VTDLLRAAARRVIPQRTKTWLERHRVQQTLACSRLVTRPWRFTVRELRGAPGVHTYRLRGSGAAVCLHHRTEDLGIFDEVFRLGWYELPPAARAKLAALGRPPRVLDLGAHVGMFGAWALAELPGAEITAFEPDPDNHEALVCAIRANASEDRWRAVRACAARADGTLSFAAGRSSGSQVTAAGEPGTIELEARDVLPALGDADLVKIDIEGSEWPILTDERFRALDVPVMVLEYHPQQCPGPDPRATVEELLAGQGYALTDIWHDSAGVGMLWATSAR
jgi:FkbM family methyltransferase